MKFDLKGKSVLVTGGNRGIGRAIALAFAEEGACVSIVGRDRSALSETVAEIRGLGARAHAIEADLFTAQGCEKSVEETVATFGGLDILINNASTATSGAFENLSDDQLLERLQGKTLAYMRCCRAALPWMRKAGHGRIVCIGGTAVRQVSQTSLPAGLSNAAITNFCKQLSSEVAGEQITVNVVHPSVTQTERHPARIENRATQRKLTPAEAERTFIDEFPIGRVVEPGDIAPLVLFLASTNASAITGQSIAVDGGATPCVYY